MSTTQISQQSVKALSWPAWWGSCGREDLDPIVSKPRSEGRPLGRSLRGAVPPGLAVLCQGDLAAAQPEFDLPLRGARGVGDRVTELRCLTYLAEVHIRQQAVGTVSEMAPPNNELASTLGFPRVRGDGDGADGMRGLERGQRSRGRGLARHALENWRATAVVFTSTRSVYGRLQWVSLAGGQMADAVEGSRQMLAPAQQRFPDDLESALHSALSAWEVGEEQLAGERLGAALDLATGHRYA
jgi:hypothetical protein